MKYFIYIVLFFISLSSHSQKKGELKIKKAQLKEIHIIQDLIKNIPTDCTIHKFTVVFNIVGHVKEFPSSSGSLTEQSLSVINSLEKGDKFFIEGIKTNCTKTHQPSYKIVID